MRGKASRRLTKSKGAQALLAAAIMAMVVTPIAIAGASGATGGAKPSAARQITSPRKRIRALARRIVALEAKTAALAVDPASLPPNGPAGGVLAGTYPKPKLGPNTVDSANIAGIGVGFADIGENAVKTANIAVREVLGGDIGAGSVGASKITTARLETGGGALIKPGMTGTSTVTCPPGTRLLSGEFEWAARAGEGDVVMASHPSFALNAANTTWVVTGRVDVGGLENTLFAKALCLND